MDLLHFEDFPAGFAREFGDYRVTKEQIVGFAREFDPQPFHLDESAAANSLLGVLAASGWHTMAMLSRMYCDEWLVRSASMGAPGVDQARWLAPVRPGDALRVRMRVVEARLSRSRPEMGVLTIASDVLNQAGAVVASLRHANMIGRRGADWRRARRSSELAAAPSREEGASEASALAEERTAAPGYFEDVQVGRATSLGRHVFRKDEMIRFARRFDPQPFHIDPEAAERSPFGGLIASGWHTAAGFMRVLVEYRRKAAEAVEARGETAAHAGPSPGFRDLRWLRPVYVDDELTFMSTPIDKRATTRPGWGLVFAHNVGTKGDGTKAFEFTSAAFYPFRS